MVSSVTSQNEGLFQVWVLTGVFLCWFSMMIPSWLQWKMLNIDSMKAINRLLGVCWSQGQASIWGKIGLNPSGWVATSILYIQGNVVLDILKYLHDISSSSDQVNLWFGEHLSFFRCSFCQTLPKVLISLGFSEKTTTFGWISFAHVCLLACTILFWQSLMAS